MRLFEKILSSGPSELIYNQIWLLVHVSDTERNREIILNSKMFLQVLDIMESNNLNMLVLRHGIWLISTLSVGFNGEMQDTILVSLLQ